MLSCILYLIIEVILGSLLTPGLSNCVKFLLDDHAKYYAENLRDLQLRELDSKIENLWLSLKMMKLEREHAALKELIVGWQKNQPGYSLPNQADQKGEQTRKRKDRPPSPSQVDSLGLFSLKGGHSSTAGQLEKQAKFN